MDYYERINFLTDLVQDTLNAQAATVSEMREIFKRLQERANGMELPTRDMLGGGKKR